MNFKTHWTGPLASGGNFAAPQVAPDTTPTARTGVAGTTTLVTTDMNGITTNTGTTNTLILILPAANLAGNKCFKVMATVASQITVVPASGEKIYLSGSGTTNATLVVPGVAGNYADLYSDGSNWLVVGYSGGLSKV